MTGFEGVLFLRGVAVTRLSSGLIASDRYRRLSVSLLVRPASPLRRRHPTPAAERRAEECLQLAINLDPDRPDGLAGSQQTVRGGSLHIEDSSVLEPAPLTASNWKAGSPARTRHRPSPATWPPLRPPTTSARDDGLTPTARRPSSQCPSPFPATRSSRSRCARLPRRRPTAR